MARRLCLLLFVIGLLALASCQRANRYPAPEKKVEAKLETKDEVDEKAGRYLDIWQQPRSQLRDLPIQFVPQSDPEWERLPAYWTNYPMIPLELAQDPLQTLIAVHVTDRVQAIKIKVPRGLPDPNEHIPESNPPTYGKWRIGKALFHEPFLPAGPDRLACAACHHPDKGFTDGSTERTRMLTLSLVNVVYNRRQFWDGRVESLEETLVRSFAEDQTLGKDKALAQHNWPGFVKNLVAERTYHERFHAVFGIDQPTQDSVAKALATYMRTILAGDSLYDRAEQVRKDKKADRLTAEHFLEPLKDEKAVKALQGLIDKKRSREETAALLAKGNELFRSKGCVQCHSAPLFTDGDFHNVGYADTAVAQPPRGTETGRSLHVPVGRKEVRLIGAFRTPTLRSLGDNRQYFHDGKFYTLKKVIEFFDEKVRAETTHLAQALKDGAHPRRLDLKDDDKEALELFLRSLEGTPVDPIVARVR